MKECFFTGGGYKMHPSKLIYGFLLFLSIAMGRDSTDARPLNFIVFLADDLGAKELSCYGHQEHRTPRLDKLADTGVQFDTAYTCPVCHPTRFLIMTGQYGHRTGVYNFGERRGGPSVRDQGIDTITRNLTFSKHLKDNGYATCVVGKWQLSGEQPDLIFECGFDEYCMWGYEQYYTQEDHAKVEEAGIRFRSRYWHPSIIENGKWRPTSKKDYGPDIFNDYAIDFIKRHKDEPFLLYYPMCLTHNPWNPTPDSLEEGMDPNDDSKQKHLKANVEYMDKLVGRLVDTLDENGLREDTVVIFTTDNGTGRDGKSTPTELGARVPLIINAPGTVKALGKTGELTDLSDIFPTLADFAGLTVPEEHVFDGVSLKPFLTGETNETRDWIYAYIADRRILRTKRWLLEDNSPLHWGHLFDCGESRDGEGYREVTESNDPEVLEAKAFMNKLLEELPVPILDEEGPPNERKRG